MADAPMREVTAEDGPFTCHDCGVAVRVDLVVPDRCPACRMAHAGWADAEDVADARQRMKDRPDWPDPVAATAGGDSA